MGIGKPYYRIARPFITEYYPPNDYRTDMRYARDRVPLVRAFKIIEKDLIHLFDYIEPNDINALAFSHRTYELLLRTATEFETNCKAVLKANSYSGRRNWTIKDYFVLNEAMKLEEYWVKLNIWTPEPVVVKPFEAWHGSSYNTLPWYRAYNDAKHDRSDNFKSANLTNLVHAIAGLYALLFAQFESNAFNAFQTNLSYASDDGFIYTVDSLLSVKPPTSWRDDQKYDFNWSLLESSAHAFSIYSFIT